MPIHNAPITFAHPDLGNAIVDEFSLDTALSPTMAFRATRRSRPDPDWTHTRHDGKVCRWNKKGRKVKGLKYEVVGYGTTTCEHCGIEHEDPDDPIHGWVDPSHPERAQVWPNYLTDVTPCEKSMRLHIRSDRKPPLGKTLPIVFDVDDTRYTLSAVATHSTESYREAAWPWEAELLAELECYTLIVEEPTQ